MLVLMRKRNESIYVDGRRIKIMVCDIRGNIVKLGIEALEDVSIHREEVIDAIERKETA